MSVNESQTLTSKSYHEPKEKEISLPQIFVGSMLFLSGCALIAVSLSTSNRSEVAFCNFLFHISLLIVFLSQMRKIGTSEMKMSADWFTNTAADIRLPIAMRGDVNNFESYMNKFLFKYGFRGQSVENSKNRVEGAARRGWAYATFYNGSTCDSTVYAVAGIKTGQCLDKDNSSSFYIECIDGSESVEIYTYDASGCDSSAESEVKAVSAGCSTDFTEVDDWIALNPFGDRIIEQLHLLITRIRSQMMMASRATLSTFSVRLRHHFPSRDRTTLTKCFIQKMTTMMVAVATLSYSKPGPSTRASPWRWELSMSRTLHSP